MSRARLFKRAAKWLKNCISTKKQIQEKKRRYRFGNGFDQLEDRIVLNADFGLAGTTLTMDNFAGVGQSVDVAETATDITFTLDSGIWSGVDIVGQIEGNGTNTLSLDKATVLVDEISATGGGFDLGFGTVNFNNATNVDDITFEADDINQTGVVTATSANLNLTGNAITLANVNNNFNNLVVDGDAISIDDTSGLTIDVTSTASVDIDAGGTVTVVGTNVTNELNINSIANGGAGADIEIDDTVAGSIVVTAGTGDVEADDAQNDAGSWTIQSADRVEIENANSTTLNSSTVDDTLYVETISGDIVLDGTISATNIATLVADGSITQSSGTLETLALLMNAGTDATLDQANLIGSGGFGIVAGNAGGEFHLNNQSEVRVDTVSYSRIGGGVVTATGLDAAKIRLQALEVLLTALTEATGNVVLESQQGANQNADGVIRAAGIILDGNGDFLLDSDNEIGNAVDPGKLAADVLGSITLTNLFGLLIAQLVCDSTTFAGMNVQTDGAANTGDVTLDTSSSNADISQEADAPIIVEGQAEFIAGAGDICLTKGDLDANTVTDNDLNSVVITSATIVEIADIDDIVLQNVASIDGLSIDSGDAITLNDDLVVANQVHLKAGLGVTQAATTFIDTLELILEGDGNFNLGERNRVGELFTDGKIAANINGSLTFLNDLDLLVDDLTYTFKDASTANVVGVVVNAGASSGNLSISTTNDNIQQSATAPVIAAGTSTFDTGTGFVALSVAGINDFNRVEIVDADEVEIVDGVGDMNVLDALINDTAIFSTAGLMTVSGGITAGTRVLLDAGNGVTQGFGSVLDTNEVLLTGTGTFTLDGDNVISDPSLLGLFAADVDGDVILKNTGATEVRSLSIATKAGPSIDVVGVNVTGDFVVELPDSDFTQAADAPFMVGGVSSFDVGTGCIDLTFGDLNADTLNDNDMDSVEVISAAVAEFVDTNDLILDEIVVSDRLRAEGENGGLLVDRDIRATNQILFGSADGIDQSVGTTIESLELLLRGTGDFRFEQLNSLGNGGTAGQVAAQIDGSLSIENAFGINFADLTFTQKDTNTVNLIGVNIDNTTGSGNLNVEVAGSTVTQDNDAPVIVTGLASFDAGATGVVNLPFADSIVDAFSVNENNFNQVAVDNAQIVEIADIDDYTVIGTLIGDRASFKSDTGSVMLDGNVTVINTLLFNAQDGVMQLNGLVDTSNLLLRGTGYFDLAGPNQIGNVLAAGVVAADVAGDINLVNLNQVNVESVNYVDLGGNNLSATGLRSTGLSNLDNLRIDAERIEIRERIIANTLVFDTNDGVQQFDTVLTDGIIVANELSLNGAGIVQLGEANRIGNGIPGDVAIDFNGEVNLQSIFSIDFDAVTFTFKDGSTRVDRDIDVRVLNGIGGNLTVKAGGHITDSNDTNIDVRRRGILIAGDGTSNITIGDTFSNFGPNNDTHFGTVAFHGNHVTIHEDSDLNFDGSIVNGNLIASSFGDIVQTGDVATVDIGTRAIEVQGNSTFIVDSNQAATNHLNDAVGRDVRLMKRSDDELIDNIFGGTITIRGTASDGTLNGNGTVRNVEIRNSVFDSALFPTIDTSADPLRNLTVWAPNSSLQISQDLDIAGNFTLFAGVDSQNGIIGGTLAVSNQFISRRLSDTNGTSINVGGDAKFNVANNLVLADNVGNSLTVGGLLQLTTQGNDSNSRIRVGVANGGARGTDSGANVTASQLRFRAKPTLLDNSEHVTINVDSAVELTGQNVGRSLMLVAGGSITDDSDANLIIQNSTTLIAENNGDITLGDNFSTNFINNNQILFGTLAAKGRNISIAEDSTALLDGIMATGDLDITAKGNIRQTGLDRNGAVGTRFIEVDGAATFRIDGEQRPADQFNDQLGRDVKLISNGDKMLMDNRFAGDVTITSTDFDNSNNGMGSVRNVEVRNVINNAKDLKIDLAPSDRIKNLFIWVPNSSLVLQNSLNILNNFSVFAGIDSTTGVRGGKLQITDNSVMRNIADISGINLSVGNNLHFRVANSISVADNPSDNLIVGNKSTFATLGGLQGNRINVGQQLSAPRGTDSGATFETDILEFRAPLNGQFGIVNIIGDKNFTVTANSGARSAVILP